MQHPSDDQRLAQQLLDRGWIRRDHLESAFREMNRRRSQGIDCTLASLLLEVNLISAEALQSLGSGTRGETADEERGSGPRAAGSGPSGEGLAADEVGSGTHIDRFEVVRELGRGGMGIVYLVRDTELGRECALKLMRNPESRKGLQRFMRETSASASLDHPHIVKVHNAGEWRGMPYFTMDFIRGRDLGRLAAEEPIEPARLFRWIREIASALHALHELDFVHRDIKPENILIDEQDRALLTDFGLAKNLMDRDRLTRTGAVVGTPFYLSPEQARGEGKYADARSDIFSLGVVLYEMATGSPPFQAKKPMELFRKIIEETPVPPTEHRPDLPAGIDRICARAMAKHPDDRYPDGAAFAADLDRLTEGREIQAHGPGLSTRARRWIGSHPIAAVALFVAVLGAGFGIYLLDGMRRSGARETARQEAEAKAAELLDSLERTVRNIGRAREKGEHQELETLLARARMELDDLSPLLERELERDDFESRRRTLQARLLLETARRKERRRKPDEALQNYRRSFELEKTPEAGERILALTVRLESPGVVLERTGELRAHWQAPILTVERARALEALGRRGEAIKELTPLVDTHLEAGILRTWLLHRDGREEEARSALGKLLQAHPDRVEPILLRGRMKVEAGNPRDGLEWAHRALELAPSHPDALLFRGSLARKLGWHRRALPDLERAFRSEPTPEAARAYGRVLLDLHRPGRAVATLRSALDTFPKEPTLTRLLAEALILQEDLGGAREALESVPASDPATLRVAVTIGPPADVLEKARRLGSRQEATDEDRYLAGRTAFRAKRFDEARPFLASLIEENGAFAPYARALMARIDLQQARADEAEPRLVALRQSVPEGPSCWPKTLLRLANRTQGLYELSGDESLRVRAIRLHERAIRDCPGFAHLHRRLGTLYSNRDDRAAERELSMAVRIDPFDPKNFIALGRHHLGTDPKKAIRDFRAACELYQSGVPEQVELLLAQAQLTGGEEETGIAALKRIASASHQPHRAWFALRDGAEVLGRKELAREADEAGRTARGIANKAYKAEVEAILAQRQDDPIDSERRIRRLIDLRPSKGVINLLGTVFGAFLNSPHSDHWIPAKITRLRYHTRKFPEANLDFWNTGRMLSFKGMRMRLDADIERGHEPPYALHELYVARGIAHFYDALHGKSNHEAAHRDFLKAVELAPDELPEHLYLALSEITTGWKERGLRDLKELLRLFPADGPLRYMTAFGFALAQREEECLTQLEKAKQLDALATTNVYLELPAFDLVRGHPRFQRLKD